MRGHQDIADLLDAAADEGRTRHHVEFALLGSQLPGRALDAGPYPGIVGMRLEAHVGQRKRLRLGRAGGEVGIGR